MKPKTQAPNLLIPRQSLCVSSEALPFMRHRNRDRDRDQLPVFLGITLYKGCLPQKNPWSRVKLCLNHFWQRFCSACNTTPSTCRCHSAPQPTTDLHQICSAPNRRPTHAKNFGAEARKMCEDRSSVIREKTPGFFGFGTDCVAAFWCDDWGSKP